MISLQIHYPITNFDVMENLQLSSEFTEYDEEKCKTTWNALAII